MKYIHYLLGFALLSTFACSITESSSDYVEQLNEARLKKNKWLRSDLESPIENQASFEGLKYFSPDTNYRVLAKSEILSFPKNVSMITSNGSERVYKEIAKLYFEIDKKKCELTAYQLSDSKPQIFIPFIDHTSAKETYGSGRYLPISPDFTPGKNILLDFNNCYNPYCAYNKDFSCPVPPENNRLLVSIKAGEKSFH